MCHSMRRPFIKTLERGHSQHPVGARSHDRVVRQSTLGVSVGMRQGRCLAEQCRRSVALLKFDVG